MRIALVASPYPLTEAPSPPLGISYVAAACIRAGAEVALFDYIVGHYTPESLRSDIDAFAPDIIGTNSVTMNFLPAIQIIREAKRHRPDIITMMGGPHVSFDIERTLKQYPDLDLIVVGEGEQTLSELLPAISDRESWHKIQGIAFKDGEQIVITPPRPLIEDLDSLPLPARHLLPMSRYRALGFPVSIITSRGCPNRCIFCLGRRMVGSKVRQRSAVKVADEIEQILAYGIDRINVADDTFTANKQRVKAVCSEIINRGLHFGWSAFSRVNTVDRETLQLMRDAGCDSVSFGIESGNPEMLKRVKKGITLDQARQAVRYCKDTGIRTHASFIIGLPGENEQTMKDTSEFAEELEIEYGYHMLAPFPGTTIMENIDQYDLEITTDDWNLYDANRAIVRTSALSTEDMNAFLDSFEMKYRERWNMVLARYIEKQCTPYEIMQVEGSRRTSFIYRLLSEGILEDLGAFSLEDIEPIDMLVSRMSRSMGEEAAFVRTTASSLLNSGFIKFEKTNGHIHWFWTHNNRMDQLTAETA